MRRPLLGTGIPKSVLFADGNITMLDTSLLDPTQVYAVTLFVWTWVTAHEPNIGVTLTSDGGSGVAVGGFLAGYLTAWKAAISPQVGVPLKLVDRVMMRGNQQLKVGLLSDTSADVCFVYGFYEVIGENDVPQAYRPLQPVTPPVAAADGSFSPAPTVVAPATAASNEYATAHQLSAKYIDLLTLHIDYVTALAYGGALAAFVRFPGNVKVPLPIPAPLASVSNALITPFEGIPMRAASASAVDVEVGFENSGNAGSAALAAYGDIYRY